jgi:ribosome-associated translation inhibitor RaiA
MELRVMSPQERLGDRQLDRIEQDLHKIAQRLKRLQDYKEVRADVHISPDGGSSHKVCIELHYGRKHLIARTESDRVETAVRAARDDLIRQINDRSRGGHSSFTKGM